MDMIGINMSNYLMELLLGINGALHIKYLAHADCTITVAPIKIALY